MRILLLTPPMTQLNTPYPATAYLTGFLRLQGREVVQADPAIELVLRLFSAQGLVSVREALELRFGAASSRSKRTGASGRVPESVRAFLENFDRYRDTVGPVLRFLQGKDSTLALRISSRTYLPEGARFQPLEDLARVAGGEGLEWAFGGLGVQDRAKYLATLYLDDLADVIREGVDSRFELSRYGEKLAASSPTFDPVRDAVESSEPTLVDRMTDSIAEELLLKHRPAVLGLTVPFPGNVYGAFRIARVCRRVLPECRILLGGGYANTELRSLKDPRVFDYLDYITLDDGERPILNVLEHIEGKRAASGLLRTFVREEGRVVFRSNEAEHDIPHRDTGTPTYDGLPIDSYLSVLEMLNPMHRIWSDGRWNKLTLAHGCYWKKCSFCDVTLDYIGRYDPMRGDEIVDRMEKLITETGNTGFHFVDEAAPPAVLRAMAERIIARGITVTWWGNVRFDKAFTPELCALLARSGCVAVSGGLEAASDRLLEKMRKGVSVEQVARVTRALTDAGILVHAYLMYGFPTQTEQETVDALERVRQLFAEGCIQSAYWHRFSATIHSPVGQDPEGFGIRLLPEPPVSFARNDLPFEDPSGVDHDRLGQGLKAALYNFMLGIGLDAEVRQWFPMPVPKAKVPKDLIGRALRTEMPAGLTRASVPSQTDSKKKSASARSKKR
jgi:radical SAM superfamily enzyme YgiQ (UPF0313 family)